MISAAWYRAMKVSCKIKTSSGRNTLGPSRATSWSSSSRTQIERALRRDRESEAMGEVAGNIASRRLCQRVAVCSRDFARENNNTTTCVIRIAPVLRIDDSILAMAAK